MFLYIPNAHCVGQTDTTSGFDLVAIFKISPWCSHIPIKFGKPDIDHLIYVMCENQNKL